MALPSLVARALAGGLEQLLPARCGVCGRSGALLCEPCERALPRADGRRCSRCWQPYPGDECERCTAYGCECTAIRACVRYEAGGRRLVRAVKFGGAYALTRPMAACMARAWQESGRDAAIVMPVPLHNRRRRQRGFNQSELLSRDLAVRLGLVMDAHSLVRRKSTAPQALILSEADRRANVRGAFACIATADLTGARIILVDDVTTTGATLGECANELFAAGATAVYGFAFAIKD